ncbi:hypothetical protein SPSYN_02293 [Sporotomaculum syntrophicum]|uniref:Bypass of forespore C C-terminal domain-containing protein n=1 Tax=Sporotomaculum syntrophicum TaxID=182264 RepID=A0A9D2WP21_9FIRM|nr:hypothetical protein [Sporotomaculum syntrophicum]KAF1084515.1 hypothetical protein SPSYN_02293 [Sporotomaculum syntrophicum]
MFKKIYTMLAAALAVFLIATTVYVTLTSVSNPAMKPVLTGERVEPLIQSTTTIRQENKYTACGDVEVYYRGPAKRDLVGLDENRLRLKYPQQEGWAVAVEGDEVVITRQIDGLCGMHREYRHLGIHEGQLAVYQGPLGHDEVLLRIETGININCLPESFLDKLNKSDTYANLNADEQLELRNAIEFTDEQALNALLENFDEYSDS